jgi:hypothetical protein
LSFGNDDTNGPVRNIRIRISVSATKASLTWEADPSKTYKVFYKDDLGDPEWLLLDGEVLLKWKFAKGGVANDSATAIAEDVLAGRTRFYRVQEY